MSLKCGIVGLPNVGKSTLFNCISSGKAQAANFPFCTIEPNIGSTNVPDERLQPLADIVHPGRIVPATVEIVSNTPQLQAVHHKQLDMLQAIFYAPGEVTVAGKTLKADRPCVMLAKRLSTEQPEVITKGVGEE